MSQPADRAAKALELLHLAQDNHQWRQRQCINLIPSENTPSRAVQLLSASDPSCRYAEHKKIISFYDKDVFYYQGTKFIDTVEQLLAEQMRQYLGCTQVEIITGPIRAKAFRIPSERKEKSGRYRKSSWRSEGAWTTAWSSPPSG